MSTHTIVDFSEAPESPIERLVWLSGVREAVDKELDSAYGKAYYDARLTGRMHEALNLHIHSYKRAIAYTRRENERRGRQIKWGDGLV